MLRLTRTAVVRSILNSCRLTAQRFSTQTPGNGSFNFNYISEFDTGMPKVYRSQHCQPPPGNSAPHANSLRKDQYAKLLELLQRSRWIFEGAAVLPFFWLGTRSRNVHCLGLNRHQVGLPEASPSFVHGSSEDEGVGASNGSIPRKDEGSPTNTQLSLNECC